MVQEITINRPFADVWEIVIQTIRQIGWDLVMSDENHGRITSTTPSSLRSWGESVNITLANHEGMILVTISSNPRAQLIRRVTNWANLNSPGN